MPKVPVETPLMSTDVPGVSINPASFGKVQESIGSAGQELANASLGLAAQAKQVEAQDAASSAYYQDKLDADKFASDLKLRSQDGNMVGENGKTLTNAKDGTPRTMTQEFHAWANDRFQKNQEAMPSQAAQQLYKERALPFFTDQIQSVDNAEQIKRVNFAAAGIDMNARKIGDSLIDAPSVSNFYSHMNDLHKDVQGHVGKLWDQTQANEKVSKLYSSGANDLIEGAYTQVLAGSKSAGDTPATRLSAIDAWRNVLAGKDFESTSRRRNGLPTVSDMLKPEDKARLEDKLLRMIDTASQLDLTDFNHRVQEAVAANKMGKGSPEALDYLMKQADFFVGKERLLPVQAAQIKGELIGAREMGKLVNPAFSALPQQDQMALAAQGQAQAKAAAQAEMQNQPFSGDIGSVIQSKVESEFTGTINRIQSDKQKDFAQFSSENLPASQKFAALASFQKPAEFAKMGPAVQASLREMDAVYKNNFPGQPQFWRPISQANSKVLADTLTNPAISTEQTAQSVRALQAAYKDRFPDLMNQMIKDGHLPESWRFAAIQSSVAGMDDTIGALKARNEVFMKNFTTALNSSGAYTEKDFDGYVAKSVNGFVVAMSQQSPNDVMQANEIRAITEVVKTKAMERFTESGGTISPEDAAKQAADSLIHRNVHLVEVGGASWFSHGTGNGQKSILALPKKLGDTVITDYDRDNIKEFMNRNLNSESLKGLGVTAPPQAGGKPSDFGPEFFQQVEQTGRWTMTKDMRGLNFWYFDRKANKDVQAFTGTDKRGNPQPLYVPLEKAMQPLPPAPDNAVMKFLKGNK